jgi:hypothetical protein
MTSATCASTCQGKGERVAAFACTANQYPSRTLNCFSAAQCTDVAGKWDSDFQPPECTNGFHYCYADSSTAAKVKLQVSIGSLTSPKDLGDYVAAAYQWMISAATLIAIVFTMVGGLQWAFGATSAEQIGKAKKRIMNGVIGLILLLSAYLILATVNPNLLSLKVPSFPMIKTVSLVDNASCDELIEEGYEVDDGGKVHECGTVGTVKTDNNGAAVADGTVCNFSKCPSDRQVCIPGEKPTCMLCEELVYNNSVLPVTPSLCAAFNALPAYDTEQVLTKGSFTPVSGSNKGKTITWDQQVYQKYEQCFYTRDADGGGGFPLDLRGACARLVVNCAGINTCSEYDTNTFVFSGSTSNNVALNSIDLGKNSGLVKSSSATAQSLVNDLGEVTLGSVCEFGPIADICAWHRQQMDEGKACLIQSVNLAEIISSLDSVVSAFSGVTAATYNCVTAPDTSSWFYTVWD